MAESNASTALAKLARLHAGLLELASVAAIADQRPVLDAIARTVSEALGWRTVAVDVYRPAWDDYEVQTVHGSADARSALVGQATHRAPLIADRFEHRGAFLVRHGDLDRRSDRRAPSTRPCVEPAEPPAWHPDDALLVPLRTGEGSVSVVLSVAEPITGRLPTDDEVDALVAIAAHAEVALRHARQIARLRSHRVALECCHEIFSRCRQSPVQEMLDAVIGGIRATLGFERVDVVHFERDGRRTPLARLLAAPYEREGCYLLTAAAGAELAPDVDLGPPSQRSGRGPHAWRDHRLLVPLFASTGELLAVIHAGEPGDRLLPGTEALQALRVFGDQAAAQLEAADRLQELRYQADHDSLTGLGNRRAFTKLLEAETARAARYKSRFTLALCDVDSLKELNDRHGHPAGDDALRRTARVIESSLRRSDGAFRIGGDEFALILVEATAEGTREITDRIEAALEKPEHGPAIRVSFGALSSDGEDDAESLMRRADEAMYEVKRARRAA